MITRGTETADTNIDESKENIAYSWRIAWKPKAYTFKLCSVFEGV